MYSVLFVALICFTLGQGEPVPSPRKTARCDLRHHKSGLSSRYWESIGHAIHSIDLQSLQMFNPEATEDNNIPTVNMNLKSSQKVLDHAPNNPLPTDFSTPEMNLIDRVLTRVGVSDDGLGAHWSPLERLVHNFHMKDLWNKIKPVHDSIEVNAAVCKCLLNLEKSGVRMAVEWVANHYATGTPITLLDRPIPALNNAEDWKIWKARLLNYYTPEALYDAAYFLKCTAN
jgi:hypothetical protein